MLTVTGGAYFERCLEPERNELYGSGLRAAAAVSKIVKVQLHCYIGLNDVGRLAANTASYGIDHIATTTAQTIAFKYSHPLATPIISPSVGYIPQAKPLTITGSAILRFGMLEGSAFIKGRRVVYDPQSPFDPRPFGENGSSAEELAIVLNSREARLLSNETDLNKIVKCLMTTHGASVVVIKRGTHGASVHTKEQRGAVPAYHTDRVWKIGSGDVFAATFAAFWAERNMDPLDAAQRASIAAATYCGNQAIPLSKDFFRSGRRQLSPIKSRRTAKPPLIYLAGPFFTMAERWLIAEARDALLQQGVRVFSPFHDVGHGTADDVVPADLAALHQSDAVLAIVDGIDAGTLFEVGYATARKTPVVAFAQNEDSEALKMLHGSNCRVNDDFASSIYHVVWAALEQ